MQVSQGAQRRDQHFPRFVIRQRTVLQQLRKVLIGVLHDGVQIVQSTNLAPARLEYANQVRVSEIDGCLPTRQLNILERRTDGTSFSATSGGS